MSYFLSKEDNYFIPGEIDELIQQNKSGEFHDCLRRMSYVKMAIHVVEKRREGDVSLLMLAALYGCKDFVHTLLSWDASPKQVELRGNVYSVDGNLIKDVTALWCALDRGHFTVAHILIDEGGADIFYKSHVSLLSYFIEIGRLDVIQFLIANNYVARDMSQYYLEVAASLGHTDIVVYFLSKGLERDIRMGFCAFGALCQAVQNGHYDCVRALCSAGVSPNGKDSNGETLLTLAVENNHLNIVDFILEYNNDENSFDDLELLASSYMISAENFNQHERSDKMRRLLQQSLTKRRLLNIPKEVAQPIAAYDFQRECQSIDEFDRIQHDDDRLYVEALLIRERILLPKKDKTLFPPLHERGIMLVELEEFDRCFQLWLHTFQLHQEMELDIDLQNFVWLSCRMLAVGMPIPGDQFLEICHLTFHASQQKLTSKRLTTSLCLIAITAKLIEHDMLNSAEYPFVFQWIQRLCREQSITEDSGRTLLHLSVSDETYRHIYFETEDIQSLLIFPNTQVTWLLLHYGCQWIDVDAVDRVQGDTALHQIARNVNGVNTNAIIELLINAGAHIDCINNYDQTAIDVAVTTETHALLQSKQRIPQLKCLCARIITDKQLNYECIWPLQTRLNRFIVLHGDLSRKHAISDEWT